MKFACLLRHVYGNGRQRDEKKIVGPSGGSPSTWEYYTKINSILGSYKSFNLETLVEESTVYEVVECALSPNNSSIDSQEEFPPSVEEPIKKKKKTNASVNIQYEFLDVFQTSNTKIQAEIEAIKEDGREAIQIERERNSILEKFLEVFKQRI
ncbi:uncharacterized protein LOC128921328 [Zeugodacus cucurbitae]|uniref:uncharacterized protein LOC128921328 n=1 Tax=Zeugodacus cucurbitae TaxID=28588 RepID=UPI0023D8EE80|nr:uncharacterized protein LOC128921328 [Zeugodacus cucurbitae]